MAKRVVSYVVLIDDLDGNELPRGEGQTVRYGWKGTEYEIDLSEKHATELDVMMSNLVSKSTKIGKMLPQRPHTPGKGKAQQVEKSIENNSTPALTSGEPTEYQRKMQTREFLKEIRAWARDNGFPDHPATGRLREGAREAWNRAHPDRPAPEEQSWRY